MKYERSDYPKMPEMTREELEQLIGVFAMRHLGYTGNDLYQTYILQTTEKDWTEHNFYD